GGRRGARERGAGRQDCGRLGAVRGVEANGASPRATPPRPAPSPRRKDPRLRVGVTRRRGEEAIDPVTAAGEINELADVVLKELVLDGWSRWPGILWRRVSAPPPAP